MRIFITGAKGFVGSHLIEFLEEKYDYKIFAPSSKELNLLDEHAIDAYVENNKIDTIIHLANKGGGRDTMDFENLVEYNLRIFFNIAKQENKVNKILSFGSGAEHSKNKPIVSAKEDDYLKKIPIDDYGFYKFITSRYAENSKNIIQLRIFGAFGEYENYRYKFITNAIVKNLLKLPITIGQNVVFDYIYIQDLILMIDWALHNKTNHKLYNVSSGTKIDLITLSNLVNETSDFKSEIVIVKEGLNNEYTSNNDRIKAEMPNYRLTSHKDAIIKMREYFKKNFDSLDKETIIKDPYLKEIENIWKGKR